MGQVSQACRQKSELRACPHPNTDQVWGVIRAGPGSARHIPLARTGTRFWKRHPRPPSLTLRMWEP